MSLLVSCRGPNILLFGLLARVLCTHSFLYSCTSVGTRVYLVPISNNITQRKIEYGNVNVKIITSVS
jgi:hypothetical protein